MKLTLFMSGTYLHLVCLANLRAARAVMCMGQVVFLINRTRFAKTILLPFYILARSHHRKTVTDWRVTLDICWTVRCAKTFRSNIYHFSVKLLSTHILYAKLIKITHPCHDPPPLLFTPCLSIPYNAYFTSEPQYRNILKLLLLHVKLQKVNGDRENKSVPIDYVLNYVMSMDSRLCISASQTRIACATRSFRHPNRPSLHQGGYSTTS